MHFCDPEFVAAREKLTDAVKEFISVVDKNNCIMTGALVVFDTTVFDENGVQMYNSSHVPLDPTSLTQSLGMLSVAKAKVERYILEEEED